MNSDLFSLQGRLALITGASRGIGFALATALAGAGARLILNGRSTEALEAAAQTLRAQGANVTVRAFDVTEPGQIGPAVEALESSAGAIDVLMNNHGTQRRAPLR